uniref:Calponin-homology (CH) domain-containing protein n=1 Tax=Panagrellus redivivus TaxID=6233 RepID=A0A7E4V6H4_PANRE
MAESLNVVVAEVAMTAENSRRTRNGKWTLAQLRQTDGIVPLQSGTNKFDSQKGKTAFGTPRNTQTAVNFSDDGKKYAIEETQKNDTLIRLQSGTNKFESQKGMSSFGAPRDVKGKHLKRIWELEFPEESVENQYIEQQKALKEQSLQQQQQQLQEKLAAANGSNGVASPPQTPQKPIQYQQKQYSNTQQRH